MNSIFTIKDVGCYADSSLGHQHIRDKLAELVSDLPYLAGESIEDREILLDSLEQDMSDDAWEEQEALDTLNYFTAEPVFWHLIDGDLILSELSDEF